MRVPLVCDSHTVLRSAQLSTAPCFWKVKKDHLVWIVSCTHRGFCGGVDVGVGCLGVSMWGRVKWMCVCVCVICVCLCGAGHSILFTPDDKQAVTTKKYAQTRTHVNTRTSIRNDVDAYVCTWQMRTGGGDDARRGTNTIWSKLLFYEAQNTSLEIRIHYPANLISS